MEGKEPRRLTDRPTIGDPNPGRFGHALGFMWRISFIFYLITAILWYLVEFTVVFVSLIPKCSGVVNGVLLIYFSVLLFVEAALSINPFPSLKHH